MPQRALLTSSQDETRGVKREALKLAQLAHYDDLLTDALVDKVYFWARIRKNRSRYFATRSVREEDVANILRQSVIVEKDAAKACLQLLELPGLKRTYGNLSKDDQGHFQKHLRKYVDIYLPDCPFEVSTTNRYMIDTQEASTTARKLIRKGEIIKYLAGIQVAITREEEQTLGLSLQDFSIVMSSRKGTQSLFLGPARFANHDCNANAKLTTKGPHSMTVIAARDIAIGEEITVSYGDDYFGIENCECLCATCESFGRNGWDPTISRNTSDDEDENDEEDDEDELSRVENGQPRVKRKAAQSGASSKLPVALRLQAERYKSAKSEANKTLKGAKTRLSRVNGAIKALKQLQESREAFPGSDSILLSIKPPLLELETINNLELEKVELETSVDQIKSQATALDAEYTSITAGPQVPKTPDSPSRKRKIEDISPCSTPHSMPKHPRLEELRNSPLVRSPSRLRQELQLDQDAINVEARTRRSSLESSTSSSPSARRSQSRSRLSTPATSLSDRATHDHGETSQGKSGSPASIQGSAFDVKDQTTRLTRSSLAASRHNGYTSSPKIFVNDENGETGDPSVRKPGDYTLTSRLLGTPYSRWVECRVCEEFYVQNDSYHLRWSCPRCERHSKLYGYQWPKADKEGKHDNEERVLDHRTVNRFFAPEEVKTIKRGRGSKPILLEVDSDDAELAYNGLNETVENQPEAKRGGRKRCRAEVADTDSEPTDQAKKWKKAIRNDQFRGKSTESMQKIPKRLIASKKSETKISDTDSRSLRSNRERRAYRGVSRPESDSERQLRTVRTERQYSQGANFEERGIMQLWNSGEPQPVHTGMRTEVAATVDSMRQSKLVSSKMLDPDRSRHHEKNGSTDSEGDRDTSMCEPQQRAQSLLSDSLAPYLVCSENPSDCIKCARDLRYMPENEAQYVRNYRHANWYKSTIRNNEPLASPTSKLIVYGNEVGKETDRYTDNTIVRPEEVTRNAGEDAFSSHKSPKWGAIIELSPEPDSSESSDDDRSVTATRGSLNHKRRSVQEMIQDASMRRFGFANMKREDENTVEPEACDAEVASPRSILRRTGARTVSDLLASANSRRFDSTAADRKKSPVPGKLTTPSRSKRFNSSVAGS